MTLEKQLLPRPLIDTVRAAPAAVFRRGFEGVVLLLVRVQAAESALALGLQELAAGAPARVALGLATEELPRVDLTSPVPDPADGVDAARFLPLFSGLTDSVHFVVPVRKRLGAVSSNAERIHVGRGPENDLILSDPTVSGAHAWFDRDADGALRLTDAGSRNGTRVNDRSLVGDERRFIQPMDRIEFGAVRSFVCEPAVLRGVLRLTEGALLR